ncbi:MAG: methylated-DNA--[protein]-cysteine S-methyltransferase [Candidatus Thermoplasmatota archaeon]|nr:methylated-DNA--[protein]-cysteine S-methyltransferase [Candidatus Thermoplasmatota archaeon]
MTRMAVYGTFRKGMERHSYLAASLFHGEYRIDGFDMYDHRGKYPYAMPGQRSIRVEIYEVEDSALATTDAIEESPSLYSRQGIMIENRPVWIYLRTSKIIEEDLLITSGDWRAHLQGTTHLETKQYVFNSPIGPLGITMAGDILTRIELEPGIDKGSEPPGVVGKQIMEYFNGERTEFTLPFQFEGTEFQKKVWRALAEIPYGKTKTYGDIAREIGSPKSSRAVGAAAGKNPIPIVVPCHRLLAKGGMGGFSGGLWRKDWLLTMEGIKS